MQLIGHHPGRAIRRHHDQHGGPGRLARRQVEAEVADVGAALCVHHHVVAMKRREAGEVGHLGQTRPVQAQQAPVDHRHDQQTTVGQPAQPRRLTRHFHHGFRHAIQSHAQHAVRVEVRKPERAVVPARRFGESDLLQEQGRHRVGHHET